MFFVLSRQFDALRKKKEAIEKQWECAHKNFTEVQQTMDMTNKRRKQHKAQMEKLKDEIVDLRKMPEKNEKEIVECQKKVEKLTENKAELEEQLQKNYISLEQTTKPLIEKREQLETQLVELKKHVDEAKAALALSESELKILKHAETTETRKYEAMKTSYEESNCSLKEKITTVEEIKCRFPEIHGEIVEKTQYLQKLQFEEQQMREQLMTLKAEVCFF